METINNNDEKLLKVEKIVKASLDSIQSPSRHHEHLNFCSYFFRQNIAVDNAQQCFAFTPQANFPTRRWRWWDWIQATFLNIFLHYLWRIEICHLCYLVFLKFWYIWNWTPCKKTLLGISYQLDNNKRQKFKYCNSKLHNSVDYWWWGLMEFRACWIRQDSSEWS